MDILNPFDLNRAKIYFLHLLDEKGEVVGTDVGTPHYLSTQIVDILTAVPDTYSIKICKQGIN